MMALMVWGWLFIYKFEVLHSSTSYLKLHYPHSKLSDIAKPILYLIQVFFLKRLRIEFHLLQSKGTLIFVMESKMPHQWLSLESMALEVTFDSFLESHHWYFLESHTLGRIDFWKSFLIVLICSLLFLFLFCQFN